MKLAGLRLYRYELPLTEPLELRGTTLRRREGLLVELAGGGDVLDPRPRLGSARIDVKAMVGTRRGMDHRWLTPVG